MPRSKAFTKLYNAMKKEYLHKEVPLEYRKVYGKKYNQEDVKSFAIATAKKLKIKT